MYLISVKYLDSEYARRFRVSALIWILTVLQKLSAPQAGIELMVSSIKRVPVVYRIVNIYLYIYIVTFYSMYTLNNIEL